MFVAIEQDGCRDGTYGYEVYLDGELIIDYIDINDMNIADGNLDPLWEKLGVNIDFDEDQGTQYVSAF